MHNFISARKDRVFSIEKREEHTYFIWKQASIHSLKTAARNSEMRLSTHPGSPTGYFHYLCIYEEDGQTSNIKLPVTKQ